MKMIDYGSSISFVLSVSLNIFFYLIFLLIPNESRAYFRPWLKTFFSPIELTIQILFQSITSTSLIFSFLYYFG